MTVFVIQKPRPTRNPANGRLQMLDLSSAIPYGPMVFLFDEDEHPSLLPAQAFHKARRILSLFGDGDYLLWAGGDPVANSIACMVASEINGGRIQFLRWERDSTERTEGQRAKHGYYMPVNLKLRP